MKLLCPSNLLQTFCYWTRQIQEFDEKGIFSVHPLSYHEKMIGPKAALSHGNGVSSLSSTQEEGDTKIILHAAYLAQNRFKTTLVFFPDNVILILVRRRYPQLS